MKIQSTLIRNVEKPHFSLVMADEVRSGEKIHFLKAIKKSVTEEVKVFFSATRIFMVHMKDNEQQNVEVRARTLRVSPLGEAYRLAEV